MITNSNNWSCMVVGMDIWSCIIHVTPVTWNHLWINQGALYLGIVVKQFSWTWAVCAHHFWAMNHRGETSDCCGKARIFLIIRVGVVCGFTLFFGVEHLRFFMKYGRRITGACHRWRTFVVGSSSAEPALVEPSSTESSMNSIAFVVGTWMVEACIIIVLVRWTTIVGVIFVLIFGLWFIVAGVLWCICGRLRVLASITSIGLRLVLCIIGVEEESSGLSCTLVDLASSSLDLYLGEFCTS